MAQFIGSCARPTRIVLGHSCLAAALWATGCGGPSAPAPAVAPAPGAQVPDPHDDAPLRRATDDVAKAQRAGDLLREAQALRIHATVLQARGREQEAANQLLAAVAAAAGEWGSDDAARRQTAGEEIDGGCRALEELINKGIITQRVTHNEAVAWYGQLHHQIARASRRAHAAALLHQRAHHATSAERYADAAKWSAEAVAERRALHLTVPTAWSLNQLGYIRLVQGDHEQAWTTFGEAALLVCGRGLNAAARATIQNACAVIRSHIEAGNHTEHPDPARTQRGLALLRDLWFVAGGDLHAKPPRLGWTGAEQSFVLERSKELHLLAKDLDGAEQALLAMLWISHRGRIYRPDVDAALWLEMAAFAQEQRNDFVRALRYCDNSLKLHQALDHTLGVAWGRVRRGRILLAHGAQTVASEPGPARARIEEAVAEFKTALARFDECGRHRNGRIETMRLLLDADKLRANPDGEKAWAQQVADAYASAPAPAATPFHFPPVDELWKQMANALATTAPVVLVVRDAQEWVVSDLVDNTERRVPMDWDDREVWVRLLRFHAGGGTIRTPVELGGYAVYIPPFHGAQILRNGLIVPVGPQLKGARDFSELKLKHAPPLLRGK